MYRYGLLILLLVGADSHGDESPHDVDYVLQIKPILSVKCYSCHGALKQRSGLRLETRALMLQGGEGGAVVVPRNSNDSRLVQRITAGPDDRMPPAEEAAALSADDIALIRKWIDQGAEAPDEAVPATAQDHWAFRPLVRPGVPVAGNPAWARNPLDAFIARQHEQYGLTPHVEAPRVILLRRLYLDLIGLPPTADEITAGEKDHSPLWYERTVERLLDDPHHGERWARHWMDIWRYSDWSGFNGQLRSSQKHIWHWRDWIVESLNADTPYDEMLRLMLAADESHPGDLGKLRATGYLARNYVLFNRNQWLDDVVEHLSKGVLGLTMKCAKCHDHKYDPIVQRDYYAMRAFFEPYHVRLDVLPGQPDLELDGIPRVFDGLPDKPTYLFVQGQEKNPDESSLIAPGVPVMLAFKELTIEPVSLPLQAWQPERRPWVIGAHLAAARKKVVAAEAAVCRSKEKLSRAQDPAVVEAQGESNVAELLLYVAKAELTSVERRAEAMRASWASGHESAEKHSTSVDEVEPEKALAAIRAERQVAVARARKGVADAELGLLCAVSDRRPAAEAKLKKARESLEGALKKAGAPLGPGDHYTPLSGAKWTPTRFFDSTRDDPTVNSVSHSTGRRTALAEWITDRRNPLTARVAANHIWTRHMGTPLVASVFDFGGNGKSPSHPEMLDWLASELVDSGWSMKHLHRLIVTSATYRVTSSVAGAGANAAKDPDNLRWWRRTPSRLESQVVRDSIFAHAGTLDLQMGGPPILPKQQADSTRRSLYFFHSANDRNLFLTVFDEAMVKECYRREQSVAPQQALALTNSSLVLDAARLIAARLVRDNKLNDSEFFRKAFSVLLGMAASDVEVSVSVKALETWRKLPNTSPEAARTHLVWVLINHNDFVTLR